MIISEELKITLNLNEMGASGEFADKRDLQKLLSPEEILYTKSQVRVQTPGVNALFLSISILATATDKNKNGLHIGESQKIALGDPHGTVFKPFIRTI
jgi:hypothetical protein